MQKVNLDLIPGCVAPIAYASQHDDGRVIRFMLTKGGPDIYILSASEVITCNLTKPDGTEIVIDVANPGAGKNYVDLVNGADDYDQEGVYSGEIVLTRNSTVQGTASFILKVEADAYDGQVTTDTATGNPCTFDTDLADNLVSLTAEIVASGGGGTPSTPIPINGYTEANITRCGKNLFSFEKAVLDSANENVYLTPDGYIRFVTNDNRLKYNIKTSNVVTFTATVASEKSSINIIRFKAYYTDGSTRELASVTTTDTNDHVISGTSISGKTIYQIMSEWNNGVATYLKQAQLELGSTATDYEAYNGNTYTVDFGQTVYGGVLDVTRGKLHVTDSLVTLDGTQTLAITNWRPKTNTIGWAYPYSLTQNAFVPDGTVPDITSNSLTAVKYNSLFSDDVEGVGTYASDSYGLFIRVANTSLTTESAINTYLANNPIQVRFKLATPIDIDLTPVQISALVGTNNITSDVGGDVNVTYIKKV